MAFETNWYTMDNKAGVNLNAVVTSVTVTNNPTQPEYPGLPHQLGDRVQGNNGSEWLFVLASATVTAFNLVAIDSSFRAAGLTSTLIASNLYAFGLAEFQPANGVTQGNASGGVANAGDAFWAMLKWAHGAKVNINASVTASPGAALYIFTAGTGQITASAWTSATQGGGRLNGLVLITSHDGAIDDITSAEVGAFSYILPGVLISAAAISA